MAGTDITPRPKPVTVPMECRKCGKTFPSVDRVNNKICPKCSRENDSIRVARCEVQGLGTGSFEAVEKIVRRDQ
jgi:Zn finger protein HypA/HybF involved in hydrogenase expression